MISKYSTRTLSHIHVTHLPIKRVFDLFFSLTALILGFPLFLLIALLIFISSPGPIFYGHKRIGRGGKIIKCWKFRTMHMGADQKLNRMLEQDPLLRKEWNLYFKLKKDPRITSFGKWLRKTSLDELPQFYNVLMGDLSVVGPRPCVEEEVREKFGSRAKKILSVRPGITGLWQTSGRSNITWDERIKLEEAYIDHRSFIKDLVLIVKTVGIIFNPKGAC